MGAVLEGQLELVAEGEEQEEAYTEAHARPLTHGLITMIIRRVRLEMRGQTKRSEVAVELVLRGGSSR